MNVSHFQVTYSDHMPILISTHPPIGHRRRKRQPRRFEEKWSTHPDCEGLIREVWGRGTRNGSPMFKVFEKIKQCQVALVEWSKDIFGNSKTKL